MANVPEKMWQHLRAIEGDERDILCRETVPDLLVHGCASVDLREPVSYQISERRDGMQEFLNVP